MIVDGCTNESSIAYADDIHYAQASRHLRRLCYSVRHYFQRWKKWVFLIKICVNASLSLAVMLLKTSLLTCIWIILLMFLAADINVKCNSFIGKVNSLLWYFRNLDFMSRLRLLQIYYTSFFGCELWSVNRICASWLSVS